MYSIIKNIGWSMTKEEEFELKRCIFINKIRISKETIQGRRVLKLGDSYFARIKGSKPDYSIIHIHNVIKHGASPKDIWRKIVISKERLKDVFLNGYDNNELKELKQQYAKHINDIAELNKLIDMRQLVRETYIDDEIIESSDDFYDRNEYSDENIFMAKNLEVVESAARRTRKQFNKIVREKNIINKILKYFEIFEI